MKKNEIPVSAKIISVIMGTLLSGFMWRCRGESGFGSSWGLYSVGLVLMLLIYFVYGKKKGLKFELIPIGALFLGLGVTGYATVFDQTAGVLYSDLPYKGTPIYSPVSLSSGMLIFAIMGFTLVPFFAFFIGSIFSDKEYKFKDYIIVIAVFFAVSTICKATIAHPIMNLINPEQVNYAQLGLEDFGITGVTPQKAYMTHFLDRAWTQEIPYFENYYMSVEHISDFFAVISVALYALIIKKDKLSTVTTIVISALTSLGTTLCSSLYSVFLRSETLGDVTVPRALENGAGWGLWEYSTGASFALAVMLTLALLPKKYTEQNNEDTTPFINNDKFSFLVNIGLCVFILALTPFRAIGIRTGKLLVNLGVLEDDSPTGDIIMIAGAVILGLFFIIKIGKNIFKNKTTPLGVTPLQFANTALPAYTVMCCILYFCFNHGYIFFLPYSKMTSIKSFLYIMTGSECIEISLMIVSFAVCTALYFVLKKKLYSK